MLTVASIPTEIWHSILSAACVDGGFTGRSLALTSRFFHAQSLSPRFHSLAFHRLDRLEQFIDFLHHRGDWNPMVEHMFLSFSDEPIKVPADFWKTYTALDRDARRGYDSNKIKQGELWKERFTSAMTSLFARVAPNLRTLVVAVHPSISPPFFSCPSFPCLEELCITGRYSAFFSDVLADDPRHGRSPNSFTFARFPVLRCLHYINYQLSPIASDILVAAPSTLTHLRFSSAGSTEFDCMYEFTSDLCRSRRDDGQAGQQPRLVDLQQLIVHGYKPTPVTSGTFMEELWDRRVNDLREHLRKCEDASGIRMLIVSRIWRKNPRWPDRLYNDWMDRVDGGVGCWVESEEEEAAMDIPEDNAAQDHWGILSLADLPTHDALQGEHCRQMCECQTTDIGLIALLGH